MPSTLPFSIDNLLGGNKTKSFDSSSRSSSFHAPQRGGIRCCGCPEGNHTSGFGYNKCRCKCHEKLGSLSAFGHKEKKRTTFTEEQADGMKRIFTQHMYLDGSQREVVAKQFNLQPAQVKRKWQNFRAHKNKQDKMKPFPGMKTTPYSSEYLPVGSRSSLSYSAAGLPYPHNNSSSLNHRTNRNSATFGVQHLGMSLGAGNHGNLMNNLRLGGDRVLGRDFAKTPFGNDHMTNIFGGLKYQY